ncbi:hypothetical protein BD289DRAFT_370089 [Coniella lustricola]|uniref:Uncharacterized protein n=1 Tax=Coniella lustricola TaxID=2025994 RepID=A0A2T3A5S7_9PEZI|nr:hypothetical protein BD289DRAFT_370089 [Coniella lustricola]
MQSFVKWLQLKIYQVEVTFSVYIFTPYEKFIFWSVVFLLFSLTALATILYLPHHIMFLVGRAWFYIHGDAGMLVSTSSSSTAGLAKNTAVQALTTAKQLATETAKAVVEGAKSEL